MYMMTVAVIVWARPKYLPAGPRSNWRERLSALRDIWATLLLFFFVIGGLYGGLFTPTEAGGMGAGGAFLIGVLRGRLNRADIRRSLLQATRTAAAVFTVLIGALAVRLLSHHHPDAAEGDRVPYRPGARAVTGCWRSSCSCILYWDA